jgi:hypothetical protein
MYKEATAVLYLNMHTSEGLTLTTKLSRHTID